MFWKKKKKLVDEFENYKNIELVKMNMFYMNLIQGYNYLFEELNFEDEKAFKLSEKLKEISMSLMKSKEHESRYAILYSKNVVFERREDVLKYVNDLVDNYDEKHSEVITLNNEINKRFQKENKYRTSNIYKVQ